MGGEVKIFAWRRSSVITAGSLLIAVARRVQCRITIFLVEAVSEAAVCRVGLGWLGA